MEEKKYQKYGIHSNTYQLLFGDIGQVSPEESQSIQNKFMRTTIDIFTKQEEKKIFTKLLNRINHHGWRTSRRRFNFSYPEYFHGNKTISYLSRRTFKRYRKKLSNIFILP